MTDAQSTMLFRGLMTLAWISAIYGVVLLIDSTDVNNTAGWVFFLVPIVLVVGERITRGGDDEDEETDEDDPSSSTPSA